MYIEKKIYNYNCTAHAYMQYYNCIKIPLQVLKYTVLHCMVKEVERLDSRMYHVLVMRLM
jgi:hypothetical protein